MRRPGPSRNTALAVQRLRRQIARLEKQARFLAARLEAANRDLEAFSKSVAHDLRTPLRTISGFIEIVRDHHMRDLPAEVRRYFELIDAGAREIDGLINALLLFSRLRRERGARRRPANPRKPRRRRIKTKPAVGA
jgi:signal transduction histidine kinase